MLGWREDRSGYCAVDSSNPCPGPGSCHVYTLQRLYNTVGSLTRLPAGKGASSTTMLTCSKTCGTMRDNQKLSSHTRRWYSHPWNPWKDHRLTGDHPWGYGRIYGSVEYWQKNPNLQEVPMGADFEYLYPKLILPFKRASSLRNRIDKPSTPSIWNSMGL